MADRRLNDMAPGRRGTIDRSLARMDELVDLSIGAFARGESELLLDYLHSIESRVRSIIDVLEDEEE